MVKLCRSSPYSHCLQQKINDAFLKLLESVNKSLAQKAQPPIDVLPPIYGDLNPSFIDFVGPGTLVTIAFAQSVGLTALSFVMSKKEGVLDRTWAAGVQPLEVRNRSAA